MKIRKKKNRYGYYDTHENKLLAIAKIARLFYKDNNWFLMTRGPLVKAGILKPKKVINTLYNMLKDDNATNNQMIDVLKSNMNPKSRYYNLDFNYDKESA